jgi:hypothetical protein
MFRHRGRLVRNTRSGPILPVEFPYDVGEGMRLIHALAAGFKGRKCPGFVRCGGAGLWYCYFSNCLPGLCRYAGFLHWLFIFFDVSWAAFGHGVDSTVVTVLS